METNKEIRNDELKVAMITLKLQEDQESENYFKDQIKNSYFLVPAVDDNNNNELNLMLLSDQNNNNYFQVYTDLEEYEKWPSNKEAKYFVLTFDELSRIVITSNDEIKGLSINPFSENIILNKEYLNDIYASGKIFISDKNTCPKKTKDNIIKILKENKAVSKAYLFDIQKNNIPGYLLIIDSSSKDKNKLHAKIGEKIIDTIPKLNIDIISSTDKIAKEITKDTKEIYKKD